MPLGGEDFVGVEDYAHAFEHQEEGAEGQQDEEEDYEFPVGQADVVEEVLVGVGEERNGH